MLFSDRAKNLGARLGEFHRGAGYIVWLIWQIVLANLHLLKLALSPGLREVDPMVIRFKTGLRSDFSKFLLAQSITLTPGTVTVKIAGDEFVVHAISRVTADGLNGSMERRIGAIFGETLRDQDEPRPVVQ